MFSSLLCCSRSSDPLDQGDVVTPKHNDMPCPASPRPLNDTEKCDSCEDSKSRDVTRHAIEARDVAVGKTEDCLASCVPRVNLMDIARLPTPMSSVRSWRESAVVTPGRGGVISPTKGINGRTPDRKHSARNHDEVEPPRRVKCPKPPAPPPPPPRGKMRECLSTSKRFNRQLRWQAVRKDKIEHTVFAELERRAAVDAVRLEALFGKNRGTVSGRSSTVMSGRSGDVVELFSHSRAQQILVVLKKLSLTDNLLGALGQMDVEADGLSTDECELLMSIVPTPEECEQLDCFKDEPTQLRDAERMVLALALFKNPFAAQRLKLAVFSRTMADRTSDILSGLSSVNTSLRDTSRSPAFRVVLRHVRVLGNLLNHGIEDSIEYVVEGFSLSVLPKLALVKSNANEGITLLHVLIAQLFVEDESVPSDLLEQLHNVRLAARRPLKHLAADVSVFHHEAAIATACVAEALSSMKRKGGEPEVEPSSEHDAIVASRLEGLECRIDEQATIITEALATSRSDALTELSYLGESIVSTHEVDDKASEILEALKEFLDAFESCLKKIVGNPKLAKACNVNARRHETG